MKKMILLALALVTAAVSQAVTVKWYVPNSDLGNWATQSALKNVYIVYSTTAFDAANNYEEAYDALTSGASTVQVQTGYLDKTAGTKLGVYADGVPDWGAAVAAGADGAYYYMVAVSVAVSNDDKPFYAVAGVVDSITSPDQAKEKGIYVNSADGVAPSEGDYVDLNNWLGGTWEAALVPEPTVMALLALGVAGLALKRKVA